MQCIRRGILTGVRSCRSSHRRTLTMAPATADGSPIGNITLDAAQYPAVRRNEAGKVVRFGKEIHDPYDWLEDPDSAETADFVKKQNDLFNGVLAQCDTKDKFKKLYTSLYDYPKVGSPGRIGDTPGKHRYIVSHNTGLQNQYVVYIQEELSADAPRRVLLDPNALSTDGTVALGRTSFSDDGTLMAYTLSKAGSDWTEIHVMRLLPPTAGAAGGAESDAAAPPQVAEKLADHLTFVKFSSLSWTKDGKGFFYNRYPKLEGREDLGTEMNASENQELMYHVLGTDQSEDAVVWAWPDHPQRMTGASVTDDGRYAIVTVSEGCEPKNMLYVLDLDKVHRRDDGAFNFKAVDFRKGSGKLPIVPIVDEFLAEFDYVANDGAKFYFQTNLNAPRYRLVTFDFAGEGSKYGTAAFKEVIAEHPKNVLSFASALKGDTLLVSYMEDAKDTLEVRQLSTGRLVTPIDLGSCVSISSLRARREDTDAFVGVSGFENPGSILRVELEDPATPKVTLWRRTKLNVEYDADALVTEQVFVTSKDGTKVPMFICRRKDLKMDGSAPALLYGYGGFNISLKPGFKISALSWILGYGGIYCVANLRGGGEYGIGWRDAGSVLNKQNVFDDFAACAEFLSSEGYTSPGRVTIEGGSNGGLLVAASCEQRPDLFGCGLAHVGVMDMLKFHSWTIGHAWVTDYGSSERSEDEFKYLLGYSPLHNARLPPNGTRNLPAILLTTADHDDRVVPAHSFKLAAELQHATIVKEGPAGPQKNPILLRVEVKAGHGAGKPTTKIIQEASECYAFAAKVTGATWKLD